MKYFEFNKHEYYAIIKAENYLKAIINYQKLVSGESIQEVFVEGVPDEITALKALEIYSSTAPKGTTITEVLESFLKQDSLIVIDGSLV